MKFILRIIALSLLYHGDILAQTQQDPYAFRGNLFVNTPYCGEALVAVSNPATCAATSQPGEFVDETMGCNIQRPVYQLNANHALAYANQQGWVAAGYSIQFYVKYTSWTDSKQALINFNNGKFAPQLYYKTLPGKTQACVSLDAATNSKCLPLNLDQYYLITITRSPATKQLDVYVDDQLIISYTDTADAYIGSKGQTIAIHGEISGSRCSSASARFAYLNFSNQYLDQNSVFKANQQLCALIDANSTADFAINPGASCKDGTAIITYTGSLPPDSPYTLAWDFDGAHILSGQGRGPIHIKWDVAGTKRVRLSVQNPVCGMVLDNIKNPIVSLPTVTIEREDGGCGFNLAYSIIVKNGAEPLQYRLHGNAYQTSNRLILSPGLQTIQIRDANSCVLDTTINVLAGPISVQTLGDSAICEGERILLSTQSTAHSFQWSPASGLDFPQSQSPAASPNITTNYVVEASAIDPSTGQPCTVRDTVKITVHPQPIVSVTNSQAIAGNVPFSLNASISNAADPNGIIYLWSPTLGLENANSPTPLATITETQSYTVTVTDEAGCQVQKSVTLTVNESSILGFPSAFTPNGDGTNELLLPQFTKTYSLTDLQIYNRWGQLIYQSNNPLLGWDGAYNKVPAPAGQYIWKLTAKKISGTSIHRTGTVLLLR